MRRLFLAIAVLAFLGCESYPALHIGDPAPVAVLGAAPGPARAERVIIISIDGLRPDAIEAAKAETLLSLIQKGAWGQHVETIRPSITLPSHTAMLTGLDFGHNPVVWNNYRSGYIPVPTVFSVAAQSKKSSAMLFSKDKFHYIANPACVNWVYGPPIPNKVPDKENYADATDRERLIKRDEAWEKLPPPTKPGVPWAGNLWTSADQLAHAFNEAYPIAKWPVTFIHFREPDENGHMWGWMGAKYINGVKEVDKAIASILPTIEKMGGFGKIALIITADHGGSDRGHWKWNNQDKPENVTIPWICVGPKVPAGLKIERPLRTFDTMPTALAFLGIGAPEGIDGKAVAEVLP
jgi:membrane-anchored protein YejM (alkaline phosphatase superfamily)